MGAGNASEFVAGVFCSDGQGWHICGLVVSQGIACVWGHFVEPAKVAGRVASLLDELLKFLPANLLALPVTFVGP